jgi:uncharacterized protein
LSRKRRKKRGSWLPLALLFVCALVVGWIVAAGPGRSPHGRAALHTSPPAAAETASGTASSAGSGSASGAVASPEPAASAAETGAGEDVASATPEAVPTLAPSSAASGAPEAGASPGPGGSPGEARLALIIDDCGQWPDVERAMIALPVPITMSVMPHAPYTDAIQHEAAAAGQGVMLHLPMEPQGMADPGPGKVTTEMSDVAIDAAVRDDLAHVPLARGVNNHEGSKASSDTRVMHDVASVLAQSDRFFIDSRTSKATVAARETSALGIPTASRTVFLDDVPTVASVEAQLDIAADQAASRGWAIAIGHPKSATLAALRARIPAFQKRGIRFVLVQDMVGTVPSSPPGT